MAGSNRGVGDTGRTAGRNLEGTPTVRLPVDRKAATVSHSLQKATPDVDTATLGARVGYGGKALLYLALATLIFQLGMGDGSQETSAQGAIAAIARQPFGTALLWVLAVGLGAHAAHSAWRFFQDDGWERLARAGRAVIYLGLSLLAAAEALGGGTSGRGSSSSSMTGTVMGWPGGTWIVAAVGLGIVAAGVRILHRAVNADWHDEFERHQMSADEHTMVRRTGRIGHLARAITYGLIGGFVVFAAVTHDPEMGGGLDKVLGEVTATSIAPFVLVPLAFGMLAYAVFAAMMARYAEG